MAHIMDDPGSGRFSLIVPADVPTGWECPRCKRMYSPQTRQCVPCSPPPEPFAGPLPRPKPGLFPLNLPPCATVPGDVPAPTPLSGPTEACCVCRSPEVAYRNYADLPFCGPCANGEPLGNLKPCPPPRVGGLCGCGEPDEDPRPAIRLSAHLGVPYAVQHSRLTREWAEVATGLQARLMEPGMVQADLEFRLTPADGETGD
jgi:hypothetical protein